ncbi:MAG: Ribosomal large subunit pseudouridine synthase C [Alphaproteobacteria bacterium MarineAlpha2_Bin1]|nr:MAG: Ribosomal large subunit pseudouridine synthase C [Alphaproteobacteria bacterium MarineAlpha2_Bin1]
MNKNRYIIESTYEGKRLDWWLKKNFSNLKFSYIEKLVRTGQVRVNGGRIKASYKLSAGEEVRVPPFIFNEVKRFIKSNEFYKVLSQRILYCDKDVIIFDKPYGLAVQDGSKVSYSVDSIISSLDSELGANARLVHRIDKNTSGALIVARSLKSSSLFQEKFINSHIKKLYWAIVIGKPKKGFGIIDFPLSKKNVSKSYEKVVVDLNGLKAISMYKVIDTKDNYSWLLLSPVTGRKHQLRAHCAEIGCPIVGDQKYIIDSKMKQNSIGVFSMTQLFARKIIIHESIDEKYSVEAPVPSHMRSIIDYIGFKYNMVKLNEIESIFEKKIYDY